MYIHTKYCVHSGSDRRIEEPSSNFSRVPYVWEMYENVSRLLALHIVRYILGWQPVQEKENSDFDLKHSGGECDSCQTLMLLWITTKGDTGFVIVIYLVDILI